MDAARAVGLKKAFKAYLDGNRVVSTQHEARIFFEAVQLQSEPSECLELIIGAKAGLRAVRQAVRVSLDKEYVKKYVLTFLFNFSDPQAEALYDGSFLQQLIAVVVYPPTAWNNIMAMYREDAILLGQSESEAFAWMCHKIALHPDPDLSDICDDVADLLREKPLFDLPWDNTRSIAYLIQKALESKNGVASSLDDGTGQGGPGGRHDNDFKDFRETAIYPSADEISSTLKPFLRTSYQLAEVSAELRPASHLDNQFRLYREDFVAELKENISAVLDPKQGKGRRGEVLQGLQPCLENISEPHRSHPLSLHVSFTSGLSFPKDINEQGRMQYLWENKRVIQHGNLGMLYKDKKVVALAFVVRNVDNLLRSPPVISLRFTSAKDLVSGFESLSNQRNLQFAIIDSSWFAYEPVLERLKQIKEIPLQSELFRLHEPEESNDSCFQPTEYIQEFAIYCRDRVSKDRKVLIVDKKYQLDQAQASALLLALESPLSIIQGPPGTGKSFIGALIVKLLLQSPSSKLLVITYTNHSTNQMLEDLLEIGISSEIISRLGSKHKASAKTLGLCFEAASTRFQPNSHQWRHVNGRKEYIRELRNDLDDALERLGRKVSPTDVLNFLELDDDEESHDFWAAFQPPSVDEGFSMAGKNGKTLQPESMLTKWQHGQGAGSARYYFTPRSKAIWDIAAPERTKFTAKWRDSLRREYVDAVTSIASQIERLQKEVDTIFEEGKCAHPTSRRVIGCTTTSAAKHMTLLKAFQPTCILVEEAGEILEPHILASLCPSVRQLVLIGDHKQLRPKCSSYALSVEKGDGFDLNRSMFERLIMEGQRHETLQRQHRMAPEISQLVRSLTYPELLDGKTTLNRPAIRGLCSRVLFINHSAPEASMNQIRDRRDADSKCSRENKFEAEMVLKIVKYLGQQGYNSSNIVVLTPYLGQLRLLREMLSKENDPVLNDLDSAELLQANLLTKAAAKLNRSQIRLSSIDNYQGEESDIVVASLTRSNNKGDIGFMKAPERLNVLISRARNCLIMVGNMETFLKASNGQETWRPFFTQLKDKEYLHDGLLVRCERHPDRIELLCHPNDFMAKCPEGGCNEPCKEPLHCGSHLCPRKCHRLADHSQVVCTEIENKKCDKGHVYRVECSHKTKSCPTCAQEEADLRRRIQQDLELERARLARQEKHRQELQDIKDKIAHHNRQAEIEAEEKEELKDIALHRSKLEALDRAREQKEVAKKASEASSTAATNANAGDQNGAGRQVKSPAQAEWEMMKKDEFAKSKDIDDLMTMIGLEEVKRTFLDIKCHVDVALQQGVSLEKDRFGCTLLGNPGTGKTTVARIYGNFLTSMGVLPGNMFEETTGSKLANMGVSGCQKLINSVLNQGGGVIFIDEAYQLSSGNNSGGAAVLDFLLAEVENLRSKIVFILAGYAKQMESFFAHNPGFPSRFPMEMKFEDYSDDELLDILALQVNARFKGRMKIEDGIRGLYCRIVSRRLGRGRGKEGFGNARAVENALIRIYHNQARRVKKEAQQRRKKGMGSMPAPDPFQFEKEDIIGPKPSKALLRSNAWTELQGLIGLTSVKESVKVLVDTLESNYERELVEQPIIEYNLNRVFLGNPGTGKTTVAKLYGQILAQIGVLSNGEVIVKCPADFVGDVIGSAEKLTKGILDSTIGKVLVIDEAYSFYGGSGKGHRAGTDIFKVAAIDTIVANVHSTPGDDRCILMLGYREPMEEMFKNMNPGLTRRFPLESAFVFEDFNATQLETIFRLKLSKQGFGVTPKAQEVALQMLERARNLSNFGNAGQVDILLDNAKVRHQKRLSAGLTKRKETLEAVDFDEEYDRGSKANVTHLFTDTIGCESIISLLQGYQDTVRQMAALGMNPKESIPFNFLFLGPPGTGKTSTARKMGRVFFDAGILASDEVVEVSTSDIIGQYIGHTGPKVRDALDKSLGKILFIDEAYRLAPRGSGGEFAQEALDEIVDACTKEKYHKKLIIILAGYEQDINHLLTANSGLSSRFPEVVDFQSMKPSACIDLLVKDLSKKKTEVETSGSGNSMVFSCFSDPDFCGRVEAYFSRLCRLESWASARDVLTLSKSIFNAAIRASGSGCVEINEALADHELKTFVEEKESRDKAKKPPRPQVPSAASPTLSEDVSPVATAPPGTSTKARTEASTKSKTGEESSEGTKSEDSDQHSRPDTDPSVHIKPAVRDAGVSDEVWDQLQADMQSEKKREEEHQAKVKAEKEAADEMRRTIVNELLAAEEKQRKEQERRRKELLEKQERIRKEILKEQERRRKEAETRAKLHLRGLCPLGYQWISQAGGWRCAGGSHFVSSQDASNL